MIANRTRALQVRCDIELSGGMDDISRLQTSCSLDGGSYFIAPLSEACSCTGLRVAVAVDITC